MELMIHIFQNGKRANKAPAPQSMHPLRLIRCVGLVVALGVLPACRTTPLNKQEAANWYARYGSMVRWVGYQGSDEQFHHYIARVMDDWNFIQIRRDELKVDDVR